MGERGAGGARMKERGGAFLQKRYLQLLKLLRTNDNCCCAGAWIP